MKILFLEYDDKYLNGLPYGFVKAGHEVLISGDVTESKFNYIFEIFKPDLVFIMGWSFDQDDDKVNMINEQLNSINLPLIYWATEDPCYFKYLSLPLVKKLNASFVFTLSDSCVSKYREEGFPADKLDFAYNSLFNNTLEKQLKYNISLVSNAYPNVLKWNNCPSGVQSLNILLYPLIMNRIRVDIWGKNFSVIHKNNKLYRDIPKDWFHPSVDYKKISSISSSSKINLGLQNYTNDAISKETFEILGSGGFLITSPNEKVCEFFDDNKDLITSHDVEETLALVSYYMRHDDEMNKIKLRAISKIMDKHTYKHRAEYAVTTLKKDGIIL